MKNGCLFVLDISYFLSMQDDRIFDMLINGLVKYNPKIIMSGNQSFEIDKYNEIKSVVTMDLLYDGQTELKKYESTDKFSWIDMFPFTEKIWITACTDSERVSYKEDTKALVCNNAVPSEIFFEECNSLYLEFSLYAWKKIPSLYRERLYKEFLVKFDDWFNAYRLRTEPVDLQLNYEVFNKIDMNFFSTLNFLKLAKESI